MLHSEHKIIGDPSSPLSQVHNVSDILRGIGFFLLLEVNALDANLPLSFLSVASESTSILFRSFALLVDFAFVREGVEPLLLLAAVLAFERVLIFDDTPGKRNPLVDAD